MPVADVAGIKSEIIAVDVEQKLTNEASTTPLQRAYFGRYYARAVCAFAKEVKKRFINAAIVIYTTPTVYADYLDKAFLEDHACLQGLPVWAARTTKDGGDIIRSSNDTIDRDAQRMCLASGGNRCIVHQYSHRGVFAAKSGSPPHIDLDRWFDSKTVATSAGPQFVRTGATRP